MWDMGRTHQIYLAHCHRRITNKHPNTEAEIAIMANGCKGNKPRQTQLGSSKITNNPKERCLAEPCTRWRRSRRKRKKNDFRRWDLGHRNINRKRGISCFMYYIQYDFFFYNIYLIDINKYYINTPHTT